MCCQGWLQWIRSRGPWEGQGDKRAKYEKTILFLASVPLFKKQLPRAELPKVAQRLTERTWAPGKTLVKEGETGRTFFLIYSGRASVMTLNPQGQSVEHAVLSEGDWLGGHTLTSERANVATIVAKGPAPLVTLEMTKQDFEESGLKKKLQFPKRPAMRIHIPQVEKALGVSSHGSLLDLAAAGSPEEQEFIIGAMSKNPNLRFLASASGEPGASDASLKELVSRAERRSVAKGTEVARCGDLGQEFFVIREGVFEVVVSPSAASTSGQQRSAESAISTSSIVERMKRKQAFMLQLHEPIQQIGKRTSFSVLVRDPRDLRRVAVGTTGTRHGSLRSAFGEGGDRAGDQRQADRVVAELNCGESFGELSLLYNTRREATFRAATDAVVYVISRRLFKQFSSQASGRKRFQECCALLDEVDALTPLLRSERRELAANLTDWVSFEPGKRILTQGKVRQSPLWYVVHSGTAVLYQDDPQGTCGGRAELGVISRAGTFGERSLLRYDGVGSPDHRCRSEVHVDAGPAGLTCLTFDGELIRELLRGIADIDKSCLPSLECDEKEWVKSGMLRCRARSHHLCSLSQLTEVCVLGRGGFGTVFLVQDPGMRMYALKRISKGLAVREETTQQLCWERDLLSMLDNPFIIKLVGTFKDAQFVYLALEAALGGDLYALFHDRPEVFLEDQPRGSSASFYTACIVEGLEHLHERKILYRDIKPENILLDTQGYGKICDMGLARFVVGKTNTQVGTPDYMAPEMIDPPHCHDVNADWWALGVLAFELLNRQPPFDDDGLDDPQERLLAIRRSQESGIASFSYDCPGVAKNFVQRLLKKLPNRLGAEGGAEALRQHAWFRKFDFDALRGQTLPSPVQLPRDEAKEAEIGGLHAEVSPTDDLFVPHDGDSGHWDADF